MEHYEKKISFLGENIQTIRKHRGMKQQELADKIGINMQSLSKIERGVNYPTFDTLEKIMDVLGVTPVSYTHLMPSRAASMALACLERETACLKSRVGICFRPVLLALSPRSKSGYFSTM